MELTPDWSPPDVPNHDDFMAWAGHDPTEEDQAWMLQWVAAHDDELAEISPGSCTDTDTDELGWAAEHSAEASEVDDGPEPHIGPAGQYLVQLQTPARTGSHLDVRILINRAAVAARAVTTTSTSLRGLTGPKR